MQHSFTIFRERGKTGQDGREGSIGTTISTTTTNPPNSYRGRGGGRKDARKNLRNSVTLSFMLIQFSTSNLERHYQPHAGP